MRERERRREGEREREILNISLLQEEGLKDIPVCLGWSFLGFCEWLY